MMDFDRKWAEMERRGNRIRRTATIIMVLTSLLMGGLAFGAAYVLTHPELIGEFAGRIVAGYEGGARE